MMATSLSRGKGTCPVRQATAMPARAYWSARPSAGLPSICSGAMYSSVPTKPPARVEPGLRARLLGQPEVGQVGMVRAIGALARGDEHVGRLDVAVDEARGMGGIERRGDLAEQGDRRRRLERALAQPALEVGAIDEAHGQEVAAVPLAGLVDGDDVGMVDGGGHLRLAQEARPEGLVIGRQRGDELDGHRPIEGRVRGPVDDAHAAAADDRLEVVAAEVGAQPRVGTTDRHGAIASRFASHQSIERGLIAGLLVTAR